ncbi:MAG: MiaB/RimO family radical SAM methylthiotransferase, partial [Planctomycetota bacterium]
MQRFSLTTLGCKVNQYDSNAIATFLRRNGWREADDDQPADLVIVNTCCVTTTAMRKTRQTIRKAVRRSPEATVVVAGCYSDLDARRIGKFLRATANPPPRVIVEGHHGDILGRLERFINHSALGTDESDGYVAAGVPVTIRERREVALKSDLPSRRRLSEIDRFEGHQRAFVKVQDGCDAFCSYCIVPYTRPRVWSKEIETIEAESRRLVAAGHREIVLVGVFLGAFGRTTALRRRWAKDEPAKLPELLRRIARIEGLWRVRLSSLEAGDLTDELLEVCRREPRVAPHFHLPLQSGSQKILQRMNRQYTLGEYRETIERLRGKLADPAITTDIIVGFPGEEESDFAATLELARFA